MAFFCERAYNQGMRKIMCGLLVLSLFALRLSAGTELALGVHATPFEKQRLSFDKSNFSDDISDARLSSFSLLGWESSVSFFFLPAPPHIDIGCNLSFGIGFPNYRSENLPLGYDDFSGVSLFMSAGPTFRCTFDEQNSLSLTPAVRLAIIDMWSFLSYIMDGDELLYGRGAFFSLNFAYKRWLVNKNGFHFGFSTGVDVDFPLKSYFYINYGESDTHTSEDYIRYAMDRGCAVSLFFGICFNFGDRSID